MEIVDGRRGHGHPISSLFEPKGSCELKIGLVYPCIPKFCCIKVWFMGYSRTRYPDMDNRPCSRPGARDDLKYVKTL